MKSLQLITFVVVSGLTCSAFAQPVPDVTNKGEVLEKVRDQQNKDYKEADRERLLKR